MAARPLIRAITHRLSQDEHTLVLGIPAVFAEYLEGSPRAT
jgi:hypothetical protein